MLSGSRLEPGGLVQMRDGTLEIRLVHSDTPEVMMGARVVRILADRGLELAARVSVPMGVECRDASVAVLRGRARREREQDPRDKSQSVHGSSSGKLKETIASSGPASPERLCRPFGFPGFCFRGRQSGWREP